MTARIMVLDDEPAVQRLVARILEGAGYTVDQPCDTDTALRAVEGGDYDLVITNSVMHGVSGARLVTRLRRLYPSLPVLHLDDQSHPRVAEFPADVPTLNKPFKSEVLVDSVRHILGR
jgi:DNA-binding response OmpR family regulator